MRKKLVSRYLKWDRKFESKLSHKNFMQIAHEIISMVILPLLLIQEGQFSVNGESMR